MPDVVLRAEPAVVGNVVLVTLRRILTIAGVTRDASGAPLGGVRVTLIRSADSLLIASSVSDASGNYQFFVPSATPHYVSAFRNYTIDDTTRRIDSTLFRTDLTVREGVTANTLVGV